MRGRRACTSRAAKPVGASVNSPKTEAKPRSRPKREPGCNVPHLRIYFKARLTAGDSHPHPRFHCRTSNFRLFFFLPFSITARFFLDRGEDRFPIFQYSNMPYLKFATKSGGELEVWIEIKKVPGYHSNQNRVALVTVATTLVWPCYPRPRPKTPRVLTGVCVLKFEN